MTVLFDNLFNESDIEIIEPLQQEAIETMTEEEYSYFLAHGSLDTMTERY